MNIHKNAQLTPHRRGELVGHIGAGERAASANGPRVWIKLKPGCARRGPTPEAVVWRLSERAGARDGAATVVGPVSRDMPVWGGVHENPRFVCERSGDDLFMGRMRPLHWMVGLCYRCHENSQPSLVVSVETTSHRWRLIS